VSRILQSGCGAHVAEIQSQVVGTPMDISVKVTRSGVEPARGESEISLNGTHFDIARSRNCSLPPVLKVVRRVTGVFPRAGIGCLGFWSVECALKSPKSQSQLDTDTSACPVKKTGAAGIHSSRVGVEPCQIPSLYSIQRRTHPTNSEFASFLATLEATMG